MFSITTALDISIAITVDDSGDDMLVMALIAASRIEDLAIVMVQKIWGIGRDASNTTNFTASN